MVSTMFLGIDHNYGQGEPLLFDTTVLIRDWDACLVQRYATWEQAEQGHRDVVLAVIATGADDGVSMDDIRLRLDTIRGA
jgi:tryptophanyl-tRNA synthetase